jgi:hypothetical protein
MINASHASEAINVTTRAVRTGDNIVVDVGATLLMHGSIRSDVAGHVSLHIL